MKKLALSIAACTTALFNLSSCGGDKGGANDSIQASNVSTGVADPDTSKVHAHQFESTLNIRYIDLDRILTEYNYAKQENSKLNNQSQKVETRARELDKQLTNKANAIQQKGNNNGYLSQQDYEKDMADFQALQQNAQQEMAKLQQNLEASGIKAQAAIMKSIENELTKYNNEKHYDAILLKSSGIFNPSLDITDEIIAILNAAPATEETKEAK